jgi:hypothetical protein
MKTLAIILLVVGIAMTLFTGFTLITKKKVVDLGAVEINKEEKTPIYWSPYNRVGSNRSRHFGICACASEKVIGACFTNHVCPRDK